MKAKILLLMTFVLSYLAMPVFAQSYAPGSEPTVTSDKDDYAPGEIAYISGSGWTLDARVDIILEETPYQGHDEAFSVNVNSDGTWGYEFQIDERHLGVEFHLFATGNVTGYVAETFFTDGAYVFNAAGLPIGKSITVNLTNAPTSFVTFTTPNSSASNTSSNNTIITFSFDPNPIQSNINYVILNYTNVRIQQGGGQGGGTSTTLQTDNSFNAESNNVSRIITANYGALISNNETAIYGSSVTLTSTFYSNYQTSTGIAGKTISFYLDGIAVGTAVTDASGVASLTFDLTSVPTLGKLNVGTYDITTSFAGDTGLLAVPNENSTGSVLTVEQKEASVSPDANTKEYGSADPALTGTLDGFLAGDNVTAEYSRESGETVLGGPYTISAELSPAAVLSNYDITYNTADFEITPRAVTVTADDNTKVYGDSDPSLTYQISSGSLSFSDSFSGAITRDAGEDVGNYAITQGTLALDGNYELSFVEGDFEITPRAVTVTADDNTKVYGDSDPSLTYQISSGSLAFSDSFSGAITRDAGEDVGNYAITQGTLALDGNYELSFVEGDFEITPRAVTVTADDNTKVYGDSDPSLTYQISSGSLAFSDSFSGAITRDAGEDVGNYAITQGTLALDGNYELSFVEGDFEITPRAVTVTADDNTKVYGDSDPSLTYQISSGSLSFSDSFSGAITRDAGEDVGNYAITQGTLALDGNYELSFVEGDFEITPRAVTVTADDNTKVYGDSDPSLTYQISSGSLSFSDSFSGAITRDAGEDVGNYAITQGTLALDGNYELSFVEGDFEITPRAVTVTADDNTKVYGDSDPSLTYQISSGSLAFSDSFSGAITRDAGEDVGNYAITQGTLALDGNYELSFVEGDFEITPRAVTVTADDNTKVYGDSDPSLTYQISSGSLAFSDSFSGAITRDAGEDVGNYAITQGTLALDGNYELSFVEGDFEITPRAVTVTADDNTKVYGDSDPSLTYQISSGSLAFSDSFSGAITRDAGEDVGNYAITQGTLALDGNYELSFVEGDFEITPRAVTVTADDNTKVYGDSDPSLTYQISSGSLSFSDSFSGAITRDAGEDVGNYAITQGTLALDGNYELSFVEGDFEITPRAVTVTADDNTKVYGDSDPSLTYQISSGSLSFSDSFSGAITRDAGEDVGNYAITQGTLALDGNYELSFVEGDFEITPRAVTVTADDNTKVYGDSDPSLTYQISSGSLSFSDSFSGAITRDAGEDVGNYAITQGTLALDGNYELSFVEGDFEITPRAVTVTADDNTKVYGDSDPSLTYQISSGSLSFSDSFSGAITRDAGEDVGNYAITQGTLALDGNYELSFVEGDFEITPRAVTVTADDNTKVYGDSDPSLTYQISSGSLSFSDSFSGAITRDAGEDVGNYAITQGTLALDGNYELSFVEGDFEITPRAVTVTADDNTKVYGDSDPSLTYQISSGSLSFSDSFSGAITRDAGEDVGNYAITQGTLALDGNYELSFVEGDFEITPRAVTVTADDNTKVYGDSDPSLTYQISSGSLSFSDSFSGAITRDAGEDVGNYAITQGTLALDGNYELSFVEGDFEITPRAVTVTADDNTKVYGDSDPSLTYQISSGSLSFSDSFSGAITRDAGEDVGNYAITQGTLALDGNYELSFVEGDFEITPRAVTVTADDNTKVYGDSDPSLTYQISSGSLSFSDSFSGAITRDAGEDVGNYAITQGTLALDGNYELSFVEGDFEITKASTIISVLDSFADCDGNQVTLTATVNSSAQFEVDGTGGTVTFKNNGNTIGTVSPTSVTAGIFSGTFSINLPLGETYNISAEFVPNSGNLSGSQTTSTAQLTVLQAFINSSVAKNANGNVVIFDGAASSLGLPSSTTLTASYLPASYPGVSYKWYSRNVGGTFSLISSATNSTYQVVANGDFVREYMVELIVNGTCVGNTVFSKVVSVEASCGNGNGNANKVQVCHVTPNGKRKTICVSANAVDALLTNSPGSFIGSCNVDYRLEMEMEELVQEMNSKLIEVKWNEAPANVSKALQQMSHEVFAKHRPVITWSLDGFDPLQPGIYQVNGQFEDERFQFLKSALNANVMVLDKPLAQDILISNNMLQADIQSGTVVAELSTLDPSDRIHTYQLSGHPDFELRDNLLIWVGEGRPELKMTITVSSTDRLDQTIQREFQLHREIKPSSMVIYPNPATKFSNILVNINESGTISLVIYDGAGRIIHSEETYEESIFERRVELDGISSGLYHVIVKVGNQVISGRLVKD
jgi:hypothetical protein